MRSWFEGLGLKLVSLGLALILWVVIAGQKSSERGVAAPLELRNLPAGLEVTSEILSTVEVRLRATPGIIHSLTSRDVSVEIDLGGVSPGERIIHLTPESVRVPFGVTVVKINPSILTLQVEPSAEKRVPIEPSITGRPAEGFEIESVEVQPREATVAGSRTRIDEIDHAFTEDVSIEGATTDVSAVASLGISDSRLHLTGRPWVQVLVRIRPAQRTRVIEDLPVVAPGGEVKATVRVELSGTASLIESIEPGEVVARVASLPSPSREREVQAPVEIDLAPRLAELTVISVDPKEVAVRLPAPPAGKKPPRPRTQR